MDPPPIERFKFVSCFLPEPSEKRWLSLPLCCFAMEWLEILKWLLLSVSQLIYDSVSSERISLLFSPEGNLEVLFFDLK